MTWPPAVAFSAPGATYLAMLFVPNLVWARSGRERDPRKENPWLVALERLGQVGTTAAALVVPASAPAGWLRLACLAGSLVAMAGYDAAWVRYFRGPRARLALYRPLGRIPVPLASLPVLAFALLAGYELHPILFACVLVLGIGHIGIHVQHVTAADPTSLSASCTIRASSEEREFAEEVAAFVAESAK